jgi:Anti-sigma factor NepR
MLVWKDDPMTTKNGKPKDGVSPPPVKLSAEAADKESAPTAMQTNTENGVAGVTNEAVIGQDIQIHLGKKLKASYEAIVRQPVPDKFKELLDELERREKKK